MDFLQPQMIEEVDDFTDDGGGRVGVVMLLRGRGVSGVAVATEVAL